MAQQRLHTISFQASQLIFLQPGRSFLHQVIACFLIWNSIFLILAYVSCSYSSRFNLKLTSAEYMALGDLWSLKSQDSSDQSTVPEVSDIKFCFYMKVQPPLMFGELEGAV